MEVRKLEAGSRAWQARPGEHYLASTGERSGLWRHRNRAPQKLVGVGFTSEGMDASVPFRRMPDSYHRSVAWSFRRRRGRSVRRFRSRRSAAPPASRVDRYDLSLGTPPHARILASSEPFTDNYPLVQEEIYVHNARSRRHAAPVGARATWSISPRRTTGRCSPASSIAWGSALPCDNFDNAVSRLTKNVVDAFLIQGPLPGSA